MIVFRADGNPQIGTGHIMRCLSLADGFKKCGRESVFLLADGYLRAMVEKRGYPCTVLNSAFDRLEDELPAVLPFLSKNTVCLMVLDSYFVTEAYMRAISKAVPLVYIDDLDMFDYPAHVVVNYNLYARDIEYRPNKRYLLGPQYVPLRQEFGGGSVRAPEHGVKNILLSTGGADCAHVALAFVEHLCRNIQVRNGVYHILLGALNEDAARIEELAGGLQCVKVHKQVSDIRTLMLACDLAVSAAGSTLFELCACGVPTVTYVLADNQIRSAAAFARAGIMLHAGDVRAGPDIVPRIFENIALLMRDKSLRRRMAERMRELVDGNGAERLAKELLNNSEAYLHPCRP